MPTKLGDGWPSNPASISSHLARRLIRNMVTHRTFVCDIDLQLQSSQAKVSPGRRSTWTPRSPCHARRGPPCDGTRLTDHRLVQLDQHSRFATLQLYWRKKKNKFCPSSVFQSHTASLLSAEQASTKRILLGSGDSTGSSNTATSHTASNK